MLLKLVRTNVSTSAIKTIATTLVDVLCGTIRSTDNLDSTIFCRDLCSFVVGSWEMTDTDFWTVVYSNRANNGSVILSKPATQVSGKTSYISIDWSDNSYITVSTGNSVASNALVKPAGTTMLYCASAVTNNITMWFRYSPTFFHFFSSYTVGCMRYLYSGNWTMFGCQPNVILFESNTALYDKYSQEGSYKICDTVYNGTSATGGDSLNSFTGSPSTYAYVIQKVSNQYCPNTNTYDTTYGSVAFYVTTPVPIGLVPNAMNSSSRYSNIGKTLYENLIDNRILMVPLIFSRLSVGWLGNNVSALTEYWLASVGNVYSEELVTVDGVVYMVHKTAPFAASFNNCPVFLSRI